MGPRRRKSPRRCVRWRSLKALPRLPPQLRVLHLEDLPLLRTLPRLPDGLASLTLKNCVNLHSLPQLPAGLIHMVLPNQ